MNKKQMRAKRHKSSKLCGLCGKKGNLRKTDCCGNWICDDYGNYQMFSYARNSCSRNHDRYTLCGFHSNEEHQGDWKTCSECKDEQMTEMYVWYGTNEYNFEVLKNPPDYEPTKCAECGKTIRLAEEGYTMSKGKYFCEQCGGV